jgi:hypothetical protein
MKGSIVIKKKDLIANIADLDLMFRSKISKESKYNIWGQKVVYESLLEDDYGPDIDWNDFMQGAWDFNNNMKVRFDFILGENDGKGILE